jgi:CHAD domain-containing protein
MVKQSGSPHGDARRAGVRSSGDRAWLEAGATTLGELAGKVRKQAKRVEDKVDEDAVHDLRTATRRLRTAITVYGHDADATDRKPVEKELRRVARRLGVVRDLDILLMALADASKPGAERLDPDDLEPLRLAWEEEREAGVDRLTAELDRDRFRDAVDGAERLLDGPTGEPHEAASRGGTVERIADRAPGLIWGAAGKVFAYEVDPLIADPTVIHEMRITAKKLRYTLEAFEDALEPGPSLIATVTALQDAGGEMHDAIVARDRARAFADAEDLRDGQRDAIRAFAKQQDVRAEQCRPTVATCLARVRSRDFRDALGRAVAGMGHIGSAA